MEAPPRRPSRRTLLLSLAAPMGLGAQGGKGSVFPAEWERYSDPSTSLQVFRLTSPAYASRLPAYYQRATDRRGVSLLFSSGRTGRLEAFRADLKTGESRQLTAAAALDPASLTLLPDERGFAFFDGPSLRVAAFPNLREREVYKVPEGWERSPGFSVSPDGHLALLGERRQSGSRLREVGLKGGSARTIAEMPWELSDPLARPRRSQVLCRQGDEALWLIDTNGRGNRRLKLAEGCVGPARWAPDGNTLLYLSFPADSSALNTIREHSPENNADQWFAKTSQFAHFGFNRDASVFVGASRNKGSPDIILLLRVGRRELTLCQHGASEPRNTAPIFSPNSRRVFFESDRQGKPAIYCLNVENLVEATEEF